LNQPAPADPLTICVADWPVTLRFVAHGAAARPRLAEWYRALVIPPQSAGAAGAPVFDIRQEPGPPFIPLEPGPWKVETEYTGGRIEFAS
jgi:hypothetical protein